MAHRAWKIGVAVLFVFFPIQGLAGELTEREAADVAGDLADRASTWGTTSGLEAGSGAEDRVAALVLRLESLAATLERGGTRDEARRAYDEVVFAVSRLVKARPSLATAPGEDALWLESLRQLGDHVAGTGADDR